MIKGCKICGISDPKTLTYIVNHPKPPRFVGFIVNWKASPRYIEPNRLKELLTIDKKKSKYVAVVVKNDESTLEKIKDLPFDYYQMYDCSPEEIIKITIVVMLPGLRSEPNISCSLGCGPEGPNSVMLFSPLSSMMLGISLKISQTPSSELSNSINFL